LSVHHRLCISVLADWTQNQRFLRSLTQIRSIFSKQIWQPIPALRRRCRYFARIPPMQTPGLRQNRLNSSPLPIITGVCTVPQTCPCLSSAVEWIRQCIHRPHRGTAHPASIHPGRMSGYLGSANWLPALGNETCRGPLLVRFIVENSLRTVTLAGAG